MMNKEQLETIKEGYRWWLEAENQADKNEFAECITTEDVPALIETVEKLMNVRDVSYAEYAELDAENKKLKEQRNALEFHLKVSSKALESEGEKADAFQRVLEKVYDELGGMYEKNQALTRHRMLEIVCDIESVLDGEPSLRDDDDE